MLLIPKAVRRLVLLVLLLGVGLFAADRYSVRYVSDRAATELQRQLSLPAEPSVTVGGFPFLTQVLGGDYEQLSAQITRLPLGTAGFDDVRLTLQGVHLPLSELRQGVRSVTVDHGSGTALLSYADASAVLRPRGVSVGYRSGKLRVTSHGVSQDATASVKGDTIVVALASGPSQVIDLGRLPLGIWMRSVSVEPDGLRVVVGAAGRLSLQQ